MAPTLKNFVPLLQTYMHEFKGLQLLFTAIYGDLDAIFRLCVMNFPAGALQTDLHSKLRFLYTLCARMLLPDRITPIFYPDNRLALQMRMLSALLIRADAPYSELFAESCKG